MWNVSRREMLQASAGVVGLPALPGWTQLLADNPEPYADAILVDGEPPLPREEQSWNPHSYAIAAATNDDVMDSEELWQNLVCRHENFAITINGHVLSDGLGRLTSQTPGGQDVRQMLINFQMRSRGGDGWLRLLESRPDEQSIHVYNYSPVRQQRNEFSQNQFQLGWSLR